MAEQWLAICTSVTFAYSSEKVSSQNDQEGNRKLPLKSLLQSRRKP